MQQDLISGKFGLSERLGVGEEDSPFRWVTTFTSYVDRLFPNLFSDHMETLQNNVNIYLKLKTIFKCYSILSEEKQARIECWRLKVVWDEFLEGSERMPGEYILCTFGIIFKLIQRASELTSYIEKISRLFMMNSDFPLIQIYIPVRYFKTCRTYHLSTCLATLKSFVWGG